MAKSNSTAYFRVVGLHMYLAITVGMVLLFAHAFPAHVPAQYDALLGPLGSAGALGGLLTPVQPYLAYVWYAAWAAHAYEMYLGVSLVLRYKLGNVFLWALQTFYLGFPSLELIRRRVAKLKRSE